MQAICVTESRTLDVRQVPTPDRPPHGHLVVEIDAAAISHGDKFFLTRPLPDGGFAGGRHDVYGASGAGRVIAVGAGVPPEYAGSQVAIYRTLVKSAESIGMWCARAQVPFQTCLILPEHVAARDYCGSFANILTVYAFLRDVVAGSHAAIVVTAGSSATGRIAGALARKLSVPAIFLVRSQAARADLLRHGLQNVLVTTEDGFENHLNSLASEMRASAVFDGVGGELLGRVLPHLPVDSTAYVYGFLGGMSTIPVPTALVMSNNLALRRFSNLQSPTIRDPGMLAAASRQIARWIDDPLFKTRIGRTFRFDEVREAMAYESADGTRAVLTPRVLQSQA